MRYAATANIEKIHSMREKILLPCERNISSISPTVTATSIFIPMRMRRRLLRCRVLTSRSRRSYSSSYSRSLDIGQPPSLQQFGFFQLFFHKMPQPHKGTAHQQPDDQRSRRKQQQKSHLL